MFGAGVGRGSNVGLCSLRQLLLPLLLCCSSCCRPFAIEDRGDVHDLEEDLRSKGCDVEG